MSKQEQEKQEESLVLPQFTSNKVYGALQIESVRPLKNGGAVLVLVPEDSEEKVDQPQKEIEVDRHYVKENNPMSGNYFTLDEEAKKGYIKKDVFEENYVSYQGQDQEDS